MNEAKQVPLQELLNAVPKDARYVVEDADGYGTQYIPVGRYCQDAATEIERLNYEVDAIPAIKEERDALAAEVLEQCRINGMSAEREDALRAELTRLKASIALDKMAENARELGLDYEPAVQKRNFCERCGKRLGGEGHIHTCTPPAAQPAPVQDLPFGVGGGLVAIKTLLGRDPCVHANTAVEMIDAILKEHPAAQPAPVQEPVAKVYRHGKSSNGTPWHGIKWLDEGVNMPDGTLLYTAAQPVPVKTYHDGKPWPVQPKPWVGLSEEEVEAYDDWADFQVGCGRQTLFDMVRNIEAKLKEKNT
jgi:hypothetical protein